MRQSYFPIHTSLNFHKVFFTLLTTFILSSISYAQTTIISPTGDGGFENATVTLAANNWLATTSSATRNQWTCGNGNNVYPGFSGSNYGYVTNDTGTKPHAYTMNTARTTHLYRSVTVPAGENNITLSFSWIGQGESGLDFMRVWLVPTSYTPSYATPISATGSAPAARELVGAASYFGQATWTTTSFSLPTSCAGSTFTLVFEWINNNSGGTNPPAGIDDISLVSSAPTSCIAPGQASAYTPGTNTSATLPATFTGSANGYLVIQSTSSTPPSQPMDGTTYSTANIGTLGSGLNFIQSSNSTTIPGTGLTGNTQYYYYIFAYNNTSCTGGPVYATGGPLAGTGITCPTIPNSVTVTGTTASGFTLNWAIPTGGTASAITYTVQITTDSGYTSNISGSPFTVSAPTVSYAISGLSASTTYYYRILASNGCSSAFVSSSTTTSAASICSSGANITSCGTTINATIASGTGAYSTSACGYSTPGREQFYTFTPSTTGTYTIAQTSSYDFIDYQYKPVSSGCSASGWTCIDDIWGSGTSPSFTLNAGVQYYILLDPESTGGGNVSFSITCPPPPVTNDEPCNASSLTASSSCSYATYTTLGATATTGVPAPGCASYSGNDVWFSIIVPSNGILEIDTNSGGITDSGMAAYSGTCSGLTLIECDDDDGIGLMSYLSLSGLTPGSTIYIRVWEFGNDNNGTFGICATSPLPPINNDCNAPTTLTVNSGETCTTSTSGTTYGATQSLVGCNGTADDDVWYQFTANGTRQTITVTPGTASNMVFEVFSGSCGSLTSLACINATTGSAIESTILNGLTSGITYFVRVYTHGSTSTGTFNICIATPCNTGNGIGTTTLGCPNVLAGGLGLNGLDHATMSCTAPACVDLEATYLQMYQTTNYTVSAITYAPPYQFSCLTNAVSVNVDDVWSPTITLPFNFCFYGNSYSSCIIGSNGMLSFNTANAGFGSGYSFSNDLPSTTGALFANTIYGVYHDIDPSKGGKVGYELITLNTGCRALVASWSDVPMFSDNSILYTGMMVLYENTNIIDVYIKEKRIDNNNVSPWNGGNAIVGIQNAAGNAAVVAPNRNGLSTNWTATNEAWRFTPSGPSIASIKWFEGSGTTGTQLSTNNILNVCPLATTTYTAEVTYTLCNGTTVKLTDETTVTVTGGKVWNGSVDTDWNKPANWTPNTSIPNSTDCVFIPNTTNKPLVSGTSYNALAGTLTIFANALLTINSNNSITVTNWVNVQSNGTFLINNSASLVQVNNDVNTGNIIYKRDAFIRSLDYVYWSSPVAGFNVSNIASPLTSWGIYKWNTTIANPNGGQGNWESAAGNTMIAGKGYIASGPSTFSSSTAATLNGVFTGVPNNGNITISIERGSDTNTALHYGTNGAQITNYSDNWNLLGNPYPSAIRGSQFLYDNNTKIMGNIRLWTHGTLPAVISSPFYNSFIYNYSPGDYLTYNFTGTSCCPTADADLFIGSGQGFFIQMIDGTAATDNITFTNSLRSANYSNSSFYRFSNTDTNSGGNNVENLERNRIWLDIINTNGQSERTLFGYIQEATMGDDHFFDCKTQNSGSLQIYSLVDNSLYNIQGRALPFDIYDEVPIGVNIPTTGNHTIALAAIDGLFNEQDIYLKDNLLNITHNLKTSPYQFVASTGSINNRFKVVYINTSLGNPDFNINNNVRVVIKDNVSISTNNLYMESIIVYNLLGQKLDTYNNINTNYFTLSNLRKNNAGLLLKIKLQTGETVIRKIIY
ncbi:fibronectin type III domain-containing protein [Flavobacterium sp.]|uniref:fibronectin type III domain-containing protein n=1 Tax=Flavobacterium sp. TaxID=239 RepID=UPI003919F58F